VPDPYLQALLSAKTAAAAEKDVVLAIGEGTWVPGRVADPLDVTTVLGNLVDNAVEAARLGSRRPATVEVELLGDGSDLYVNVSDTGDGVPGELREAIFRDGVSTRRAGPDRTRGLGLALARHTARARGGDVTLADPGLDGHGAVFVAWLPGVLLGARGEATQ
jgi:two-component system CitB family sensor kinase